MTNFIQTIWEDIENFMSGTAIPDAEKAALAIEKVGQTWLSQFETDFGKQALTLAISAVGSIASGTPFPTVVALAATVGEQLAQAAITTAEQDAETVVLNAARTALTAASIPPKTS